MDDVNVDLVGSGPGARAGVRFSSLVRCTGRIVLHLQLENGSDGRSRAS